jgi:hypothetical protein
VQPQVLGLPQVQALPPVRKQREQEPLPVQVQEPPLWTHPLLLLLLHTQYRLR